MTKLTRQEARNLVTVHLVVCTLGAMADKDFFSQSADSILDALSFEESITPLNSTNISIAEHEDAEHD